MKKNRQLQMNIVIFLFISALVYCLFYPSFAGYFFQDDWFSIFISRAKTWSEFFALFMPRNDVIYYRPLGMQIVFLVSTKLFGLNALPFHLLVFLFHCANIFLVWRIASLLTGRNLPGLLTGFFYSFAVIHFIPFYWPSTFAFVLGPFWYFLSFYRYILYRQKKDSRNLMTSFICFILGLFTNELVVTLPAVLFVYEVIFRTKNRLTSTYYFFMPLPIYYFIRYFVGSIPLTESYKPGLSNVLSTARAYFLWLLNWPEEIRNQFIGPFTIHPDFTKSFASLVLLLLMTTAVILVVCLVGLIKLFNDCSAKKITKSFHTAKLMLFGFLWLGFGLLPLLAFPKHTFPYYLAIPCFGFFLIFSILICLVADNLPLLKSKFFSRLFIFFMVALWFYGAFKSIQFSLLTHWAPKRARITKVILGELMRRYTQLPDKTIVRLPNDQLLRVTFNDQLAIQLLYGRDTIKTEYSEGKEEDREKFIPKNDQELIERYPFKVIYPAKP